VVTLGLLFILYGVNQVQEQFEQKMLDVTTSDIIAITQNTKKSIQKDLGLSKNYPDTIKNNLKLQETIDEKLSTLITKNIKYAYILYKDSNGVFRFLGDGADDKSKAFIDQKFDVESSKYIQVYEKKSPILIQHDILQQLSITYLEPFIVDNEVQLILTIDFSITKTEQISQIIALVKQIIIFIIGIIIAFGAILLFQSFRYSRIKKEAYIDKLTNVFNRNYLQEYQHTINLEDYVLATLDIDHFKKINDTYGHTMGDEILKEIAKTIRLSTRASDDIVIRYGGEEFIILAKKQKNSFENGLDVINRIFENIQKNKFLLEDGNYLYVTVSIGVNTNPEHSRNFLDAFKLADASLYEAKESGRNKIVIHSLIEGQK
jgi:diguanylate cyclase (GGDEF)-like protein